MKRELSMLLACMLVLNGTPAMLAEGAEQPETVTVQAEETPESTKAPTAEPTKAPTAEPTKAPTEEPTKAPTAEPTEAPAEEPAKAPAEPTDAPAAEPTEALTEEPTEVPAEEPAEAPAEESDEEAAETPAANGTAVPEVTEAPAAEEPDGEEEQPAEEIPEESGEVWNEEASGWELDDDGVLTISMSGAMPDYAEGAAPWLRDEDGDSIADFISEIVFTGNLTRIGSNAFYKCSAVDSVTIPASVTSIGTNAFRMCKSLTELSVPGTVKTIGTGAFAMCTGIEKLTLNNGTETIGEKAFYGLTALKSVTIPASVTSIGAVAFGNTDSMTEAVINCSPDTNGGNIFWKNPGEHTDRLAKVTFGSGVSKIGNYGFGKALKTVNIDEGVTAIGDNAFQNCTGLTTLALPATVKTIGTLAFAGCSNLTAVSIACSPASIGASAFDCGDAELEVTFKGTAKTIGKFGFGASLRSVKIESGVAKIGKYAFEKCENLTSVSIPASVTVIDEYAFGQCSGLTTVTMTDNVTTLGAGAFENCGLLSSMTLSANIPELPMRAFYYCGSLKSVALPEGLTRIGANAFTGAGLTSVTVPYGVKEIDTETFMWCDAMTEVSLPDSVTKIGVSAFESCKKLTGITLPADLSSIGKQAFRDTGLTTLTIPVSVTGIGADALRDCPSLTEVHVGRNSAAYTKLTQDKYSFRIVTPPAASGLILSETGTVQMNKGGYLELDVSFYPEGSVEYLTWTSSNGRVATVSNDGTVLAVGEGTAVISVSTKSKVKTSVKVQVVDPAKAASVSLDQTGTVKLKLKDTLTLAAAMQPATAVSGYTWSTSSKKIATVAKDADENGVVTGVKEGTATVTVKTNNGKTASVKVQVLDPMKPAGITLDQTGTISLKMGDPELKLRASVLAHFDDVTPTQTVTWKSSSASVATVKDGTVTPLKEGTVTITAKTSNGKTASVKVKITDPVKAAKVELIDAGTGEAPRQILYLGEQMELAGRKSPENATSALSWSSSSAKIAKVENGIVTPVKEGTVTVTVRTSNGKTAKVKLQVVDPRKPAGIALKAPDGTALNKNDVITVNMGDSPYSLVPEISASVEGYEPYDTVTWKSSSAAIAAVENGTIIPKKEGTAVITAKTVNGKTATVKVKIADPVKAASVKIEYDPELGTVPTVEVGKTLALTAVKGPEGATSVLTWSCSSSKYASVSAEGVVTGKKAGTVTVTVKTSNGKSASLKVKVVAAK